ncbi:MAG: hypothetical protein GF398_13955 [Chitinivibrionales bacterium]|nr:hypothetical protein [Chitinivibrionales bacterium]
MNRAFIQIHYHDRLGGVGKVIRSYAESFEKITPAGDIMANCVICASSRAGVHSFEPAKTVHMPSCDYRRFVAKKQFTRMRDELAHQLAEYVKRADTVSTRLVVVAHNITLGKNSALSSAFAQLAHTFSPRSTVHFFSVIHDLAEEGRADMLAQMRKVTQFGETIDSVFYPALPNITYVVLNKRIYHIVKAAGLPVRLLPNPVEVPRPEKTLSSQQKNELVAAIGKLAANDGAAFYANRPLFFYPVRCISRKNIPEAIIIAALVLKANLVTGGPGTAEGDIDMLARLRSLVRAYHLPVVFDGNRVCSFLSDTDPFQLIYWNCDACISTAVAEGFGYALYEPWLFKKPLIGRHAKGFTPGKTIQTDHLYAELNIPATWIDLSDLQNTYRKSMQQCYPQEVARPLLAKSNHIDFGMLDMGSQFTVLQKLLTQHAALDQIRVSPCANNAPDLKTRLYPPSLTIERVCANQSAIADTLAGRAFLSRFNKCYFRPVSPTPVTRQASQHLQKHFCSPEEFRLLLTPSAS